MTSLRVLTGLLAVLSAPQVDAFSVRPSLTQRSRHSAALFESSKDFGTAMPEEVSVYEKLGIEEDNLALGINPEDLLTYVGT